jgi:hypothetical protein
VVLHEFGHALTARRFGINTRDITLLPIGGLAQLERIGLLTNPVLLFVALLVWTGAAQEAGSVLIKAALVCIPVRRDTVTHYRTLTRGSRLQEAVDLVLRGSQQDFPVVHDGLIEGVLTRRDLIAALACYSKRQVAECVTLRAPSHQQISGYLASCCANGECRGSSPPRFGRFVAARTGPRVSMGGQLPDRSVEGARLSRAAPGAFRSAAWIIGTQRCCPA